MAGWLSYGSEAALSIARLIDKRGKEEGERARARATMSVRRKPTESTFVTVDQLNNEIRSICLIYDRKIASLEQKVDMALRKNYSPSHEPSDSGTHERDGEAEQTRIYAA